MNPNGIASYKRVSFS